MIPYVAKGSIKVRHYMQDDELTREDIRIVMAASVDDAREKYREYWNSQTDEYSVYYRVGHVTIEETLL